jgi:hypothetical protein
MKNTKIKILLALTFSLLMLSSKSIFAADFEFKEAPKLVEETSSGVTISWEKLQGAT